MKTLARYFADLRSDAGLSYGDISKKASTKTEKISRHVVWKLENGRPIKASSLGVILRRGLGLKETDPVYLEAFALWSAAQANMKAADIGGAVAKLQRGRSKELNQFISEVVESVRDLDADDRPAVLEALRNVPKLKLWLASRG